jgi:hypothetical protein
MRIIMVYVGGCLDKKTMEGDLYKPYDDGKEIVNLTVERYLFTNNGTVGKQFEVRHRGKFYTYEVVARDEAATEVRVTVNCVASD